ncbi:MAG TPA: oxygenase MpaB family protein [Actinomycetota bacterium]|nr:oxygenase MpaB family protein [Actinomycetota bacterium]
MSPRAPAHRRTPRVEMPGARRALRDLSEVVSAPLPTLSGDDLGHFGPGSVAWRIHRDPAYGIGGVASLFHQAMHPVAMAAVDEFSDFAYNAWVRTWRTTEWVFTVVFGGTAAAETASARVRRLHERIRGTDPVTGRSYRADDQDLLLWVHSVGVEYSLRAYETYAHRLPHADADRFVAEMRASGALVGLEHGSMPETVAELRSYLESMRAEMQMTEPAYAFFRAFLKARMPLSMRGLWALHVVGMAALLPPDVRRAYDLPRWIPTGRAAQTAVRLLLRGMNVAYPLFPPIRAARRRLDELERG